MTDQDLLIVTVSCGLLFFITWVMSVWFHDASLVDRIWGLGFLTVVLVLACTSTVPLPLRAQLVIGLVGLWSIRLSIYLYLRNRKKGEDPRYQAFRENWGSHFEIKSLLFIYTLQLALCLIIATPLMIVLRSSASQSALNAFDFVGCIVTLFGIVFETIADTQLSSFKANPSNRGQILNTGLWSLCRHPNYFGEFCVWWGFFLIACRLPFGPLTIVSPLVMTVLLLKVSGVSLLENKMHKEKPMYRRYMETTPAFFPRLWTTRR